MVTFHKNGNNPRNLYNEDFGDYSYLCSRYEKDCFIYNYVGYDNNDKCTGCAEQGGGKQYAAVSTGVGQDIPNFTFWVIKTIIEVYDICEKSCIFAAVFYL